MIKLILKFSKWLLIAYILILFGLYFFQEKLFFPAKRLDASYKYNFKSKFEEFNIKGENNSLINGLLYKNEKPKGVILFFHGNKGNLKRWGNLITPLTTYGYDLLVIDYIGYGKSTGKRNEKNLYKNANHTYQYLKNNYNEDSIIVYGRSLGCTFATYVSSMNSPKQLILEAPFYSLISVAKSKFSLVPYEFLLKYKFKTYEFINKVKTPTIIFHGDSDKLIDINQGKELYNNSNKEITTFITLKGGTHHNLNSFNSYKQILKTLLN